MYRTPQASECVKVTVCPAKVFTIPDGVIEPEGEGEVEWGYRSYNVVSSTHVYSIN